MLASFMNFKQTRGRSASKPSFKFVSTERTKSPTSPASFSSPEIIEITGQDGPNPVNSPETLRRRDSPAESPPFPSDGPEYKSPNLEKQTHNDASPGIYLSGHLRSQHVGEKVGDGTPHHDAGSEMTSERDQETEQETSLNALDINHKLSVTSADPPKELVVAFSKRTAPSPIKIPSVAIHGPKVQIERQALSPEDSVQQSPESSVMADSLITHPFVLSNDNRNSRYRSGSSMPRQDSATLPIGDDPYLNSPGGEGRGASTVNDPPGLLGDTTPPPVPPLPASTSSHPSSPEVCDATQSVHSLKEQTSGSSLGSLYANDEDEGAESSSSPAPSPESYRIPDYKIHNLRRISRISEVPSPASDASSQEHFGVGVLLNSATSSIFSRPTSLAKGWGNLAISDSLSSASSAFPSHSSTDPLSAALTPVSGKDIDQILDHYGFGSPTVTDRLSPRSPRSGSSSPIHETKRESNKIHKQGKFFGASTSPSSARGRLRWNLPGSRAGPDHVSKSLTLLPIGERPRSLHFPRSPLSPFTFSSQENSPADQAPPIQISSYPPLSKGTRPAALNLHPAVSSAGPSLSSLAASDLPSSSLAPPSRSIFNRQRSGSLPSPILVVRDSKDMNAYNITVTPGPISSTGDTPLSAEHDHHYQTFPETPSAFSPMWSPESTFGPGFSRANSIASLKGAQTATLADIDTERSNLAQLSLKRASTLRGLRNSVTGPRKANSATVGRTTHPYARPASTMLGPLDGGSDSRRHSTLSSSEALSTIANSVRQSTVGPFSLSTPSSGIEPEDDTKQKSLRASPVSFSPGNLSELPQSSGEMTHAAPPIPSLMPPSASDTPQPALEPVTSTATLATPDGGVLQSRTPSPSSQPSLPSSLSAPYTPVTIPRTLTSTPPRPLPSLGPPSRSASPLIYPRSIPPLPLPPPPRSRRSPSPPPATPPPPPFTAPSPEVELGSAFSLSFAAPPPSYYSVFASDRDASEEGANTSHVNHQTPLDRPPSGGAPPQTRNASDAQLPNSPRHLSDILNRETRQAERPSVGERSLSDSSFHSKKRARPRLPSGPRRPIIGSPSAPRTAEIRRPRADSNSLAGGSTSHSIILGPSPATHAEAASPPTPKFLTPEPKWKGYTMDTAKWTFTSNQLQSIVSRAIKQSAEASSVRLLHLDTLDEDIPEEMKTLGLRETDLKARYKALTRKRSNLLGQFPAMISAGDAAGGARLVESLNEVCSALDHTAEDLHSVDVQMSQLTSLRDVHSSSALAMALRKLNTSFLKQVSEANTLRAQVEALEMERDEAWQQAEGVANDFDTLSKQVAESLAQSRPVSQQSSRILAVRKSASRASAAGLWRSQRSPMNSAHGLSLHPMSTPRDFRFPVPGPAVSQRQPSDALADPDLFNRYSGGFPTDLTPTSATKALLKAQEELYHMLGISLEDPGIRRRPNSIGGASASSESTASVASGRRPRRTMSLQISKVNSGPISTGIPVTLFATLGLITD